VSDPEQTGAQEPPAFSVLRGRPSDDELAALVAVLAVLRSTGADAGGSGATDGSAPSGWSAYWRATGAPLAPGPGAWRASARP
jgi:hypothetical protein